MDPTGTWRSIGWPWLAPVATAAAVGRGRQMENQETAPWSTIVGAPSSGSHGYLLRDLDSPSDGLARTDISGIPRHRLRVLDGSVM